MCICGIRNSSTAFRSGQLRSCAMLKETITTMLTRHRLKFQVHRPPLPSILLANAQSLENKLKDLQDSEGGATLSGKELVWPIRGFAVGRSIDINWDMFQSSSTDVNKFTEVVTGRITKLVDDVVLTVTAFFWTWSHGTVNLCPLLWTHTL